MTEINRFKLSLTNDRASLYNHEASEKFYAANFVRFNARH